MTFEGQYLTYAEYQELGGSAIGNMPFNLLEFASRRIIDINTFDRLKNIQEIPQEVKICEYNLINSILQYDKTTTNSDGNIASESIDGYSISYITADRINEIIKSYNYQLDDIIQTYLSRVIVNNEHILYIGV